jgi:hypothetical protein
MKVCLLIIAKDEEYHLEEFLDHYFNIVGIDHIFWIDNNNEPLKPVVINDNRVTVIDKRNVDFCDSSLSKIKHQTKLLNEVYQEYIVGSEYDWCCNFDGDELLDLKGCNIKDYLSKYEDVDYIPVIWTLHGNNGYILESELPSNKLKVNYGYDNITRKPNDWKEYKPIFRTKPSIKMDVDEYTHKETALSGYSNMLFDENITLHHYRIQCLETYFKHKVLNGIYNRKNIDSWMCNLLSGVVFDNSKAYIPKSKIKLLEKLVKKYSYIFNLDDRIKLKYVYNIDL